MCACMRVCVFNGLSYLSIKIFDIILFIPVIYLTCTMALGTLSVCFTIVVLNMHHRNSEVPMPPYCKLLMLNYLARALCVRTRKNRNNHNHRHSGSERLYSKPESDSVSISIGSRIYKRKRMNNDATMLRPMLHQSRTENGESNSNTHLPAVKTDKNEDNGRASHVTEATKKDNARDWQDLALVLDRLFFWIVFVLMSGSALFILMVPLHLTYPNGSSNV